MASGAESPRPGPARARRLAVWAGVGVAVLAVLLAAVLLRGRASRPGARAFTRPSIVLILTDDQRWDSLGGMPIVRSLLAEHGVTFTNSFVSNSLCCPSRASILTGQYSHTTGIYSNRPPQGGFADFRDSSTVATWLHTAGYKTGLFGKYLNGYTGTRIPPGWDQWHAFTSGRYYDYTLNENGFIRSFGNAGADYSTDVLASLATSFIRRSTGPLFVYFAPSAPHQPARAAPRDAAARDPVPYRRPPNLFEPDVSDKPRWIRRLPPSTPAGIRGVLGVRLDQYRSLLGVDRAVGDIVEALKATDRLSDSVIVFTSDNGLSEGSHRWFEKQAAYEESIRVPLVLRFDPLVAAPRADNRLVVNVDLAPTFAAVAGVAAPGAEGLSLIPLLQGPGAGWRTDFLLEHVGRGHIPTYCGVRTTRFLYVFYSTREEELYDLRRDPYELSNRASSPLYQTRLDQLRARLKTLCRPPPPGLVLGSG
jgi:N-acetylglucosamine-6-sulfatase